MTLRGKSDADVIRRVFTVAPEPRLPQLGDNVVGVRLVEAEGTTFYELRDHTGELSYVWAPYFDETLALARTDPR